MSVFGFVYASRRSVKSDAYIFYLLLINYTMIRNGYFIIDFVIAINIHPTNKLLEVGDGEVISPSVNFTICKRPIL